MKITECKTLYELLDTWLLVYKAGTVSESTLQCYRYIVQDIKRYQKDLLISEFSSLHFQNMLEKMVLGGLSKSTVTKAHMCMKSAFRIAEGAGIIRINPTNMVMVPRNAPEKSVSALTVEQQARVIEACSQTQYGEYALFLLCTGLRISEFIFLKWDEYDAEHRCLYISKSKTEAGVRCVPLMRPAQLILAVQPHKSKYIFLQKNGRPLTVTVMRSLYRRLRKLTGVQEITNHVYRHTFATRAIEQQIEYTALSKILGHTNPYFTVKRYVQPDPGYLRSEIMKLDEKKFAGSV